MEAAPEGGVQVKGAIGGGQDHDPAGLLACALHLEQQLRLDLA